MADDIDDIDDINNNVNDDLNIDEVLDEIDVETSGESGLTKEDKEQIKKLTNSLLVELGLSAKLIKKILPKLREVMVNNRGATVDYVKFLAEEIVGTQNEIAPHLTRLYEGEAMREAMKIKALLEAGFSREEAMNLVIAGFGNSNFGLPMMPIQFSKRPQ